MKKLFLTLCVALFSVGAFAQEKGDMAVGASFNYNTDASMVGIGARYQYFIIDNLRCDAEFAYYLKKDGVSMFTIWHRLTICSILLISLLCILLLVLVLV